MAKTVEGTEFYMVDISTDDPTVTVDHVENIVRGVVRTGDGVLAWRGHVFVAVVGDVPGAGKAARRLMGSVRRKGLNAKVRLVSEPFPDDVTSAAEQVKEGKVKVFKRLDPQKDVSWK